MTQSGQSGITGRLRDEWRLWGAEWRRLGLRLLSVVLLAAATVVIIGHMAFGAFSAELTRCAWALFIGLWVGERATP